jgi:hypothetical protein
MSEKIAAIEKYLRGEDSLKVTDDILNTIERLEYFPDSGSLIPLFYRRTIK